MQVVTTVLASEKLVGVIIAGGVATRLSPYSEKIPKALMEIAPAESIIDLLFRHFQRVGIDEIVVVTHSEHAVAFERHLTGKARVVVLGEGEFGNLNSVVEALEAVGPHRMLLAMSDHVFEIEILRRLIAADDPSKSVVLCLDMQPSYRNLREGLKVHASSEQVYQVGKTIPPHTGVDTGLFIVAPDIRELATKLNEARKGQATISDLVNSLAKKGEVGFVDVSGRLWIDVDTPEDLVEARKFYGEILRRGLYKPTDGPISRYLNRPVSSRLSLFLFKYAGWATPNLFTVASFLLAMASTFLLIEANLLLGALLVHVSSVLDGVDGELARLRGAASHFGSLLDSILDRVADISLVVALGLLLSPGPTRLILTGLAAFGVVLVSYVFHLPAGSADIEKLRVSFPWATRDVRLFAVAVGSAIAQPALPLIFCAVAPLFLAVRVLAKVARTGQSADGNYRPTRRSGSPEPQIAIPSTSGAPHEIRRNAEGIVVNLLKAAVAIFLIEMISGTLEGMTQPVAAFLPAPLDIVLILGLARLAVIAYFGYRVLLSMKFFADMATHLVVERLQITQGMYARATTDMLYLVILLLSWYVVSPIVGRLPEIGLPLRLAVSLTFLAVAILLLYDLLRIANRGMRWLWDAAITKLSDLLTNRLPSQSDAEESRKRQDSQ